MSEQVVTGPWRVDRPLVASTTDTPARLFALACVYLWGVGQHLPDARFYLFGIGLGDLLLLSAVAGGAALGIDRWPVMLMAAKHRAFVAVVTLFVALGLLSGLVNAARSGMLLRDLVETLRPLYYLLLAFQAAVWVERFGVTGVLTAYLLGILTTGFVGFLTESPNAITVFGFRTMYNPNVIGYLIGVATMLASLLVVERRYARSTLFVVAFAFLSLFTYSKGTWLMVATSLATCFFVFRCMRRAYPQEGRLGAAIVYVAAALGSALAIVAAPLIIALVGFKLDTSGFGMSAAEGSTVSQRWGYVVASLQMAMEHPVVGVGISNYEAAYDRMRDAMGVNYFRTDNPHSAFLYVLACMGIPALAVYLSFYVMPFLTLLRILPLPPFVRYVHVAMIFGVFTLYGSLILHVLSQPPWWFFAGLVFGWEAKTLGASAPAAQ